MTGTTPARHAQPWRVLLGDYPDTHALRAGLLGSPSLPLEFADVAVPNKAFKLVVRDVKFDVAELALMTFLMARSRGVPLCLLPVVVFARNPLPLLICRSGQARLRPRDLEGRRVGVRAYTTTTAVWMRALLADEFGVNSDRVQWITFEEGHVAGVPDPPNVVRHPHAADMATLLRAGVIDAAIVAPLPTGEDITRVIADADAAWRRWQARTGALTVNHIVVVRESLADDPGAMRLLFDLFRESRARLGAAVEPDDVPIGFKATHRTLEVAIAAAAAQGLLARPLAVDDLVTDALRAL